MNAEGVTVIVGKIRPLLAGLPPAMQSAILADLLAIWLAGHHVAGDAEATLTLRAHLLAEHCQLVWRLVPVNARDDQ
jgi:hypothetical protein